MLQLIIICNCLILICSKFYALILLRFFLLENQNWNDIVQRLVTDSFSFHSVCISVFATLKNVTVTVYNADGTTDNFAPFQVTQSKASLMRNIFLLHTQGRYFPIRKKLRLRGNQTFTSFIVQNSSIRRKKIKVNKKKKIAKSFKQQQVVPQSDSGDVARQLDVAKKMLSDAQAQGATESLLAAVRAEVHRLEQELEKSKEKDDGDSALESQLSQRCTICDNDESDGPELFGELLACPKGNCMARYHRACVGDAECPLCYREQQIMDIQASQAGEQEEAEEPEYEVEAILEDFVDEDDGGVLWYNVKFVGYEQPEWIKERDLTNCEKKLRQFKSSKKQKKRNKDFKE